MLPQNTSTPELSDDDRAHSVARGANRRRSTRACDQCRRTKSKCERSDVENICRACAAMGISCTYVGPSHKRGPPKGYILALERRLHQVEALLGTIIGSDDPRARTLIDDLTKDQLAAHIVRRVKTGPFGPRGRLTQPFGSTKEDFLAAIMTGPGDESPRSSYGEENYALVSPDRDWQDRLQSLLQVSAPQTRLPPSSYTQPPPAAQYALPPFRQLSSPVHHQPAQQAHYTLPSNLGGYSTPTKHESPVTTAAMLAPLQQHPSPSQTQQHPQPQQYVSPPQQQQHEYVSARWDGFGGYSRIPDDVQDSSKRNAYELGPSALPPIQHNQHTHTAHGGQSAVRDAYQPAMPRCGSAAAADPQRWFFGPDTAVS